MKTLTTVIALLLALALGVWLNMAGPCKAWKYSPAAHVPARCLKEFR